MEQNGRYFSKDQLSLRTVVDGAKMWGVSLDNTLLTYFEIDPHSSFEMHQHESEQITLVLAGELYFKVNGEITCVKEGEVMALPANLPHGAFTKEKPVKAVDSWSPVMEKYKQS